MTMYTDQDIADAWRAAMRISKGRDALKCGRAFLAALAPHPAEFGFEDETSSAQGNGALDASISLEREPSVP